jgi:uncharacterized DUF497 family protein
LSEYTGNFEWDLGKEVINILKHKVDFATAAEAFTDPHRHISIDQRHSVSEIRFFCVGKVNNKVITVRFLYRKNKIRIIGAGYWRKGVKYYDQKNAQN